MEVARGSQRAFKVRPVSIAYYARLEEEGFTAEAPSRLQSFGGATKAFGNDSDSHADGKGSVSEAGEAFCFAVERGEGERE
ncbi:hypothetical protein SKAU_G00023820 [Synaphobranchus kaupii]|uniref:Uncharacterized protein n=1 Tax=Synaphobranchus kaupii TaxID=118154 RepID=A0A9Q1GCF0_SYNKA|nr:hypothetical protein SKAU_G00023820 [Synaphobranchus kaupii]